MLRADHARVQELFERFGAARRNAKERLVEEICNELEVHAQLEEEVFYPIVREHGLVELIDEARVEHETLKELIRQLRGMSVEDDLFEAKVKVLGEYVKHHVREEHGELFPQARAAKLDLNDLGERMRARKAEITSGLLGRIQRAFR